MSDPNKAVRKWADVAMFESEKVQGKAEDPPQVILLNQTPDPLGAIASMWLMYKGKVIRDLSEVTDEERKAALKDGLDNRLNTPLEAVQFHFLIEGLHRGVTHQMVRQRVGAAFAQESMRFAVKDGETLLDEVYRAPSLHGTTGEEPLGAEDSVREWQRNVWDEAVEHLGEAYMHLIGSGMPAEEARGLMPTNIKTRIHYVTNLRALREHAGNRLCTQAQFEWRLIFSGIVKAIREHKGFEYWTSDHSPNKDMAGATEGKWQQLELTDGQAFRPACFQVGHCPFEGLFDRHCTIRDRVRANAAAGSPPSEWEQDHQVASNGNGPVWIPAIRPEEWLADPAAARKAQ